MAKAAVEKHQISIRLAWHEQLYELSNEAALRETCEEIVSRACMDLEQI